VNTTKPIELSCKIVFILEGRIVFYIGTPENDEYFLDEIHAVWDFPTFFEDYVKLAEFVRIGKTGEFIIKDVDYTSKQYKATIKDNGDGTVSYTVDCGPRFMPAVSRVNELHYHNPCTTREHILAHFHDITRTFADHEDFAWGYVLHHYGKNGNKDYSEISQADAWLEPRLDEIDQKYYEDLMNLTKYTIDNPKYWELRRKLNFYYVEEAQLYAEAANRFYTLTPKQEAYLNLYKKMLYELKPQDFSEFYDA